MKVRHNDNKNQFHKLHVLINIRQTRCAISQIWNNLKLHKAFTSFWSCLTAHRILFLLPGTEPGPGPWQWEHWVLITGPPGNPQVLLFNYFQVTVTSTLVVLKVKCTFVHSSLSDLWHASLRIRDIVSPWITFPLEKLMRQEKIKCNPHLKITTFWIICPDYIIYFNRNTEAKAPIIGSPIAKSKLIGKASDAGKDWGQEEKRATEDEMTR